MKKTALNDAIDSVGSVANLARALKIDPTVVSNWKRRGIPAIQAIRIERATAGAVHRSRLRPDLYPPSEYAL